jgi:hypothetical protein
MVPSQPHAVDSRTRSRIDSVDREKADRRVLLLLPAPLDRLVDVEHLGAEEYFLPNLKQFVEHAVERCGKGEPQAEFEEGNDTVQSCDDFSRSVERSMDHRRLFGFATDDSMATMAPSRSGGNICRLL